MCGTCGCGKEGNGITISNPKDIHETKQNQFNVESHKHDHIHIYSHTQSHDHNHDHSHHHDYPHDNYQQQKTVINLEQDVLQRNEVMAARNKGYFEAKDIFVLNLVSSPGSGKTSILEKTLIDLKGQKSFYVIEGDQQTLNDANRINILNIPVIQINTGKGCHLESDMVFEAVKKLNIKEHSILMIENVGNLVCPSMFNLGENKRVVIISTTEGEDKPIKYPDMFYSSDICIINKIDLLPYLNIKVDKIKEYALQVNPNMQFFEVSAITGEGMSKWYNWLKTQNS